jgi:hypothetical protein
MKDSVRHDYGALFAEEARRRCLTGIFGDKLGVKGQDDDVRACFLIHLLPRLEALSVNLARISSLRSYNVYFVNLMDRQLLPKNLRLWERGDKALEYSSFYTIAFVRVMLYPSITVIKAHNVSSDRLFHRSDRRWSRLPPKYGQSNVHTIELYRSQIRTDDLPDILRLPRALRRFVYRDGSLESSNAGESPRVGLARALGSISSTLEVLELGCSIGQDNILGDKSGVCSLHKLKALRVLSVKFSVLASYSSLASEEVTAPAVRLSELLPPLLESLIAYTSSHNQWRTDEYFDCIKWILIDKSDSCLNHLRTITCRADYASLPDWVTDLARASNVFITLESN